MEKKIHDDGRKLNIFGSMRDCHTQKAFVISLSIVTYSEGATFAKSNPVGGKKKTRGSS